MAKNKRIKIDSKDSDGNKKEIYLQLPASDENKQAQLAYNKAFKEALQSGAILRQKLQRVMTEQGIWDEEKEERYQSILQEINQGEKKLSKGGISLSEARETALEMRKRRVEFRGLIAERSSMDSNTAEGQADNERFSHLVYICLKDAAGKKLFKSKEDYENSAGEPYVIEAAGSLAEKLYGLDPDYDRNLPENKFLESYKFSDTATRLINKDGHLIDIGSDAVERLIDEDGRYVAYDKDEESYFVDRDGERVNTDGDYESEAFTPFLDDAGKDVEVPSKEVAKSEETTEEEAVEASEKPKPTTKRRTTKRSTTKAKTE
jgi:hypothetical protein|tara:strand:+ start:52 stop:1008 length:957 start_codon:yes stop_codon:yes gene_type:complete